MVEKEQRKRRVAIDVNPNVATLLKIVAAMEARPVRQIASEAVGNFLLGRVQQHGTVQQVDDLVSRIVEKIRERVTLSPDL